MRKYIIWFLIAGAVLYIAYTYFYKKKPSVQESSTQVSDWGNFDPYDDGIHGQHAVVEWLDAGSPPYKCGDTYYPNGGNTPLSGLQYADYDAQPPIIWIQSSSKYMINPCKMNEAIPMIVKYREDNLK